MKQEKEPQRCGNCKHHFPKYANFFSGEGVCKITDFAKNVKEGKDCEDHEYKKVKK